MFNKRKAGFTLIELMIVVAIVGLLATITVSALQKSRAKGRDAKRISDLTQIRTAMALSLTQDEKVPQGGPFAVGTPTRKVLCGTATEVNFFADLSACDKDKVYMTIVPQPGASTETYQYTSYSGSSYCIQTEMEVGSQDFTTGPLLVNEGTIRNGTCPPPPS